MINYEIGSELREEKLNSDQQLERNLKSILYRISCPSAQDLGEFQLGMLESAATGHISQHLQSCPHCRQELAQLDDFLAATAPHHHPQPASKFNKISIFMAELIQGLSVTPSLNMALRDVGNGQNSSLDSYEYSYVVGTTQWEFDVEKSQTMPDMWAIEGSDIPNSAREDQQWQLEVWRTDLSEPERILLTDIDPLEMSIDGLAAGVYTLIFNDGLAEEVQIPDIQIR